ncbi:TPA: hypothetical protein PIX43_001555 [Staphylococcus aureus]|nr:hypothetical protein SA21202_1601 [Staphylococcus aureus subsp. aureus 21202]HDH4284352.1 hypothetical protein [Staphylococcus aureus]HDH4851517.1 hypothetical protein [Staphylococcus aureus]
MKSELSNSGIDVTVKDVEKYMNRYNEVMEGKMAKKLKSYVCRYYLLIS